MLSLYCLSESYLNVLTRWTGIKGICFQFVPKNGILIQIEAFVLFLTIRLSNRDNFCCTWRNVVGMQGEHPVTKDVVKIQYLDTLLVNSSHIYIYIYISS